MRIFLTCLLFLSPIFVMGHMESNAVETIMAKFESSPREFQSELGHKADHVADWLYVGAPEAGAEFQNVKQLYKPHHDVPVTREMVASWIDNDLSRIRAHSSPPY
ncbi:secreted protein [Melampsora americana]|nr:secreted protein [Melampsora americana]